MTYILILQTTVIFIFNLLVSLHFLGGGGGFICSEKWNFNIDLSIAVIENYQKTCDAQR